MAEYWLISAPGDKTCQQTFDTMNNLTHRQHNLCVNHKFHIPDLKVGTLDQLVGLSDDLGKLDNYVEQITRKVASYLGEVLEDQRDKLHENLLANNNVEKKKLVFKPFFPKLCNFHSKLVTPLKAVRRNTEGPGPPDESTHSNLTGKSSNLSNSRDTTTTTCSACHGGSLNLSSESSEREFDTTSCNCDYECSSNNCALNNNNSFSDTFDWWFHRDRVSSNCRSSPVSSCCGSSQGRSSPDTDINCDGLGAEPPAMPLSPADLPSYITRFQWDMAKYPIKQSLRNIADIISKQIGQIDADLKTKSTGYNNLKGNLQTLEKKQTGSLVSRNLADLVKKEHFIMDSEYLTTLLVVVPKPLSNDWLSGYEMITDMIVPRSSQLINQDNDYCLYNVTLFKKVVDEFKIHARERKFIVRDFVYNEEELAAGKNEITKLVTDKKKQFGPLVRWLKVNFSEAFCALVHVKALRVFVESVLRYGLPVNFQAILIEPNKKSIKRLRDCLNQLYAHLDGSSANTTGGNFDNVDIPGLGFGQSEYFPYVFYKLNIDMIESSKV